MADASTLRDSPSLVSANKINPTNVDNSMDEPKFKPSEAYALVLGHRRLRVNSVKILQRAQALRGKHFQIDIPLCRMISLQVVRMALAFDIEKMKVDFVHGYRPKATVFYVLTIDFSGIERAITHADRQAWDVH